MEISVLTLWGTIVSSQYKQIGNAVPVNLAHAMRRKLIALLNNIEEKENKPEQLSLFGNVGA